MVTRAEVGTVRSLAFAAALAAPVAAASAQSCSLSVRALASGSSSESYSDLQEARLVTGVPAVAVSASGSTGAAGCSAASQAFSSAAYGTLAVSGSGTGVNCFTSSSTIYADASAGFRDLLQVSHPSLPSGTRVPVRLRVAYAGTCSSIQPASPFCLGTVDVICGVTFGTIRVREQGTGIFEVVSNDVTVNSFITIEALFTRSAGASSASLQPLNGPATPVSCGHDALITVTIEPLIAGIVITACSGHNYTPPCLADFNADGTVDPDDLSDFIACYFTAPPCPQTDINSDGIIDPDDLADFIAAFFSGAC
jgi:hypothetical protein